MLHFKALVTVRWHLSDKIFISSHFKKITETCFSNIAYMLYFQKILGFPITGRLEICFLGRYVSKNTSKRPFSHDKISCPTLHKVTFCKNNGQLGAILDLVSFHTPWRTNKTKNLSEKVSQSDWTSNYF